MAGVGSPCFFSLVPSYLCTSISALPVSGWSETKEGPSCGTLKGQDSWLLIPTISFPARGALSSWVCPLGTKQCWLGEWNDAGKIKLFYIPLLHGYSQGLVVVVVVVVVVPLCC